MKFWRTRNPKKIDTCFPWSRSNCKNTKKPSLRCWMASRWLQRCKEFPTQCLTVPLVLICLAWSISTMVHIIQQHCAFLTEILFRAQNIQMKAKQCFTKSLEMNPFLWTAYESLCSLGKYINRVSRSFVLTRRRWGSGSRSILRRWWKRARGPYAITQKHPWQRGIDLAAAYEENGSWQQNRTHGNQKVCRSLTRVTTPCV